MPTNNRDTLLNMKSKLQAMGNTTVVIGEPKSEVQDGLVAIIPQSGRVDETVLNQPREIHIVMLRRYENMIQEPQEDIEFHMDFWRAQIMADVFGEFDLGGTVAYALPTEFQWQYGYQTLERTMYRLLDLQIGYRLDGNATFAA